MIVFPPGATDIFSFRKLRLLSFLNFFIIASFNSSIPSTAVYFVSPRLIASIAASLIWSGVSKSGSPAERLTTSSP